MKLVLTGCIFVIPAISLTSSRATADLFVDSWLLGSTVSVSPFSISSVSETVENPYEDTLFASLGSSYSNATLNFGWLEDTAHFDVLPNFYMQEVRGSAGTGGRIQLVPAVDSIVTGYGSWQFAWPNSARGDTHVSLYVLDPLAEGDDFVVLEAGGYGGNEGLGPPYGNFTFQDSGLLLAGREYEIHYEADVYFYTALPAGTHADASGEIHFTITPVPEPATIAFLTPTFLLALRRPRR